MGDKRMTTDEVLEAIARERARLMTAVDALGQGASTIPVTEEGWTSKDVLAHLIHWAGQIAWAMGAPLEPPAYVATVSGRPSEDEWNDLVVRFYKDLQLEQVRAELDRVVDALVAEVRKRTDDEMNATDAIPWAGESPLWHHIGNETFEHWPAHAADIERAAGNPGSARTSP